MPEKRASRSLSYLSLVVSMILCGALAGSLGLMIHSASRPDDPDLSAVVPWVAGGVTLGFVAWYVLSTAQRKLDSRRHARR